MNIFVLDKSIELSAQYHCDKHVVKMILEYAQLLSTAVRESGLDAGYKSTHKNHPCNIWARNSLSNWLWLKDLAKALNDEYRYRYNKTINHKSWDIIKTLPEPKIDDIGLTQFPLCMPEEYKNPLDAVESYRTYYICEKSNILVWTKRGNPWWLDA